jgi:hypothetical protein
MAALRLSGSNQVGLKTSHLFDCVTIIVVRDSARLQEFWKEYMISKETPALVHT